MPVVIKTLGQLDDELTELLQEAGYQIEPFFDVLDVDAEALEGLSPVLLSDVGRYTARGIVKGLHRDVQATQRFFALDPLPGDPDTSEQELRALTEFTQTVSRTLAKTEIIDGAVRFFSTAIGARAAAVHTWNQDDGITLARSLGFAPPHIDELGRFLVQIVNLDDLTFRRGLRFDEGPFEGQGPNFPLTAVVPILAKDELMGVLSVELNPHFNLSLETLKAMGRQMALSLHNGELLARSEAAIASLRRAQQSMAQSEKLAAVGLLAAGIAHEINNPASFIITNITVLRDYMSDLLEYGSALETALVDLEHPDSDTREALNARLEMLVDSFDIPYLRKDAPELIDRCLQGMHRIRDIVQDLRSFAHRGTNEAEWTDLNQMLNQVLKLAGAELRHKTQIELDLRPLPMVLLESTKLSQVLLNLIINAYHAFGERDAQKNILKVGSAHDDDTVTLSVSDNGVGIPEDDLDRIFEPFFTTKPVGIGTGLGLAISYEFMKKMGGDIQVQSSLGRGTQFRVIIPLSGTLNPSGLPWRIA